MKYIVPLLLILLLTSCKENESISIDDVIATEDIEQIRNKKKELEQQQKDISSQIEQLSDKIKALNPQENNPLVTVFSAKTELFEHYLELQGTVNTKQNIVVLPEFSGILTNVYVKEGQYVNKGQLLAKIDDAGLSQQLAQIQIQADLAKTTYERQKRLWEQNIGSEMQYLQAKSNYEAQQKSVTQMKQQLNKTIVKAPFSGIIDDVITEQGNVVAQGQSPLFRLINLNNMYIETDIPERYITDIKRGEKVQVEFPILNKKINTIVKQAGSYINPANRTFKIEIDIPNKDKTIKPNLTAKIKVNDYTSKQAILIPQSIISENAQGEQYVYIVKNKSNNTHIASRKIITTGKTQGDRIEVLDGIAAGIQIIEEGARSVKNDQIVEILVHTQEEE